MSSRYSMGPPGPLPFRISRQSPGGAVLQARDVNSMPVGGTTDPKASLGSGPNIKSNLKNNGGGPRQTGLRAVTLAPEVNDNQCAHKPQCNAAKRREQMRTSLNAQRRSSMMPSPVTPAYTPRLSVTEGRKMAAIADSPATPAIDAENISPSEQIDCYREGSASTPEEFEK
eukprot:scaffold1900_cov389-Prasinococcus_capsulatus_cf.AAC.12